MMRYGSGLVLPHFAITFVLRFTLFYSSLNAQNLALRVIFRSMFTASSRCFLRLKDDADLEY